MPQMNTKVRTYTITCRNKLLIVTWTMTWEVHADLEESMEQFQLMLKAQKALGNTWMPPEPGFSQIIVNERLRTTYSVFNDQDLRLVVTRVSAPAPSVTWENGRNH